MPRRWRRPQSGTFSARGVSDLSGGELQRVLLARALLRLPNLLILDEPVQGVDHTGEAELYRLIGGIVERRGSGVLMVSHDLHIVMAATDRVVCLNRHVCCTGAPEEVVGHEEFRRLFGPNAAGRGGLPAHPRSRARPRRRGGPGPPEGVGRCWMTSSRARSSPRWGVACVAAPVGCVLLWRRMAYFGDTMAHSALLGVAIGAVLGIGLGFGVFGVAVTVALALVVLERTGRLATDTLLGVLSHSTLALGLVVLALSASGYRHDLIGFLFGDVLAVTVGDLAVIWGGGAICLAVLAACWRGLVAATLHEDLARAEGVPVFRLQMLYVVLMAAIVAVGMKVVGVLLIVALAIIPAAAARALSRTPEQMAVVASAIGVASGVIGLFGSLWLDTPSGPSIVVAAMILFLASFAVGPIARAFR